MKFMYFIHNSHLPTMLEICFKQQLKKNNKNTVVKLATPKHQQWSANLMQSTNCYKGLLQAVKKLIGLSINQDYQINPEAAEKATGTHCACYRTGRLKHRSDLLKIINKASNRAGNKTMVFEVSGK